MEVVGVVGDTSMKNWAKFRGRNFIGPSNSIRIAASGSLSA